MIEVNRFSFLIGDMLTRNIVSKDDEGFYHISKEVFVDPEKIDPVTGNPKPLTYREDIHGKMDKDAYIGWLANCLFNTTYINATERDKMWLIGSSKG